MALIESLPLQLGQSMPDFSLQSPSSELFTRDSLMGDKGLLILFTCNHCPYAIAIWPRIITLSDYARSLGVNVVAINPNIHPDYPDDAPEKMTEKIQEWGIPFPYLIDASQDVAKQYQAQCTPDLYLLNQDKQLVYHGRLDDNWQNPDNVSKEELKEAITALSDGQVISDQQYPSIGCSIKWK